MLLIAHRGASGHAPENTLAAFRLALEMGAKAIELDVHQSRDHELVIVHDFDLKRVGRLPPRGSIHLTHFRIGDLDWSELRTVDVGSWFDERFHAERLPKLEEVMDLVEGKAELHIEVKKGSRQYPGIEERLAALLKRRRAWAWTAVSSFDHEALYSLRSIDSRARLGYLLGLTQIKTALKEIKELKAESLNLSSRQVDARMMRECRDRDIKVLVYTVNTERSAQRLQKMGVDGIFTNFPEIRLP
ncbi:MAG: hypothetical protein HY549_07170 [Elusimicrobia bacterium]|nr:hypothetical protein [Elusimicrobiota bacterium]